ncbi:MAG: tRNA (adenosine(37)-N6)-threonylcarbamoyltransferase complex ATPase subunit type 1 TsaE [Gammaproteobacteria bacterium]|nr:tRNA (adenosine(37)-N6)-threonylcarbamoyltransferase complex ATPase subunit type 1 TsaE [Gammaproteobacteria bacterium]
MITTTLVDEQRTRRAGASLATILMAATRVQGRALLVFIRGELGAGKSTLVRGLLRQAGVVGVIPSPTYSLVEFYRAGQLALLHMDAYRLADATELDYLGIDGVFAEPGIVLIEWPDHVAAALPAPDLEVHLAHVDQRPDERQIAIFGNPDLCAQIDAALTRSDIPVAQQTPT